MRITSVSSTYCFVLLEGQQAQVARVTVAEAPADVPATVSLSGEHLRTLRPWRGQLDPGRAGQPGGPAWAPANDPGLAGPGRYTPAPPLPDGVVVEVPVLVSPGLAPGTTLNCLASVEAEGQEAHLEAEVVVREPGWRMVMVPHFHYDPVWWNTQAGYTSGWDELVWAQDKRETFQHTGLALVEAHLQRARVDPLYKFVLAEVDYLKPFWDLYPDRRAELRALVQTGRLEIVGGTYNEPNTNLTGAETAIRAVVYGMGFQRDVMCADPRSAWQLDVFAHDPQFPGIMADCGLDSSAWARGPFHQWGPRGEAGSNSWMQFPSEFEWVAPNGKGLLTSYMPNHYSSGWEVERATTLEGAMWRAYELFCDLAAVSAAPVTLLPVGTDYTPPSRFVTDIATTWGRRYTWPRFEVGLPREFFAAVRSHLEERGVAPSPQSRDMGPIYTGKDVSFIDTKQAQRLAEARLADGETLAALANLLGAPVPRRALDKAWRQLVFGAHHDGITGSESDQVYLDLLGGWRESFELARQVEEYARLELVKAVDTSGSGANGSHSTVVVINTTGQDRSDLVTVELPAPATGQVAYLTDETGGAVNLMTEAGGTPGSVVARFMAKEVPGIGYRSFRLGHQAGSATAGGWSEAPGLTITNDSLEITADPQQGGGLSRVRDLASGFELVPEGEVANELVVYPEYPNHPRFGEGPWHLLPSGPPARSRLDVARALRQRCALGERLVVEGRMTLAPEPVHSHGQHDHDRDDDLSFSYRQVTTLWQGSRRAELRTEVHDWAAKDRLLRLRFPTTLSGATPVSAVGDAVVGRGFALIDVDAADAPWTLDNPAAEWFGLSTTLVVEASDGAVCYHQRSIGVAELVTGPGQGASPWARQLVVALVQKGVTATCSEAQANRYGALLGDSNLPDFRLAVGAPSENPFVADALGQAPVAYKEALESQLAGQGHARLLIPANRPLRQVWQPNADLRGARDLPILIVAGRDAEATGVAVAQLVADIESGIIPVRQAAALVPEPEKVPEWTAALVNRGTPGFAVDSSAAMHVSLLRACSGWPSGVWIDPPRRYTPDGSAFELQHWSHVFEHALVIAKGDWRQARLVEEAQAYNRPLVATVVAPHAGPLPARARLLGLAAAGDDGPSSGRALVAALKPAGNDLASSEPGAKDGEASATVELSLRCYESVGQPVDVEINSHAQLTGARQANLLEEPGLPMALVAREGGSGARARLSLGAGELATARLSFRLTQAPAGATLLLGEQEVAQPVFSRYWLHNKGAAPLGNQGLAVHLLTTAVAVRAGSAAEVTAQVASGAARGTQAGHLDLLGPDGWDIDPPSRLFALSPGAFTAVPARFSVPAGCRPGRYFVAAQLTDDAGQRQEDVLTVDVLPHLAGVPVPASFAHPSGQVPAELEAAVEVGRLDVGPGDQVELALRLSNRTAGELRAEVQLLSPVETWPWVGPWVQAVKLPPREQCRAVVTVRGPTTGWLSTWALFKVTYFGRLWYSPSVLLRLGQAPEGVQTVSVPVGLHARS